MLLEEFSVNKSNNWSLSVQKKSKELGKLYKKSQFNLIEKGKRSELSEGRNYGFATTLAYREDKTLHTTHALTCCKDFENDVLFSFHTKKPYSIYGLKTEYIPNLFQDGVGYLIFSIEKQGRNENEYSNYKRDYETLPANIPNLLKFINWFEEKLNFKSLTKINQLKENRFVAIYPSEWSGGTYLISLYILLLRVGMFYKGEEPMQFLKQFKYDNQDAYMVNTALPKIERLLKNGLVKQDLNAISSPHNLGICTFNW